MNATIWTVTIVGFAVAMLTANGGTGRSAPASSRATGGPGAESLPTLKVVRLAGNPIITPALLGAAGWANINGPSLIRVPDWVDKPPGRYYLYFADHDGKVIKLAYADRLQGSWALHKSGVLSLQEAKGATGHIASPDLIVDDQRKEFRMYFHGPARGGNGQMTFVALSKDALNFTASAEPLTSFYFRAFRWDGMWYGMAKGGLLYRSKDGLTDFERGPNPLAGGAARDKNANTPGPRHVALDLRGSTLWVYYSSIGDAPERILRVRIELSGDWKTWRASEPQEILRPETDWEGAGLPVKASVAGAAHGRENALRDPAIFREDDKTYLLYSVAGESGIAIAELMEN